MPYHSLTHQHSGPAMHNNQGQSSYSSELETSDNREQSGTLQSGSQTGGLDISKITQSLHLKNAHSKLQYVIRHTHNSPNTFKFIKLSEIGAQGRWKGMR